MNRWPRLCLCLIFLLGFQATEAVAARITIDSEDQFAFARHVMEEGDYLRAVGEFERLIYFFPEDRRVPESRYLIGLCYLKAKDYEAARKVLAGVRKTCSGEHLAGKALFLIGESYYVQGLPGEGARYFKRVIEEYRDPTLRNQARYRLGWSHMQADRWREASESFNRVEERSPLHDSARGLSVMSLKGEDLPLKDPTTAGVMAGVLPGLGHAYCNRYKDGLVAFLLNGLFIWAAVESFDQDQEVLGGILCFLELGWYTGNIYSAVNCAHKHNRAVKQNYRKNLSDRLDFSLFPAGNRHLGLALKIEF